MKMRFISVVGGCTLALGALACDNNKLTSINQNPNNPIDAPAGAVFTNAARVASEWVGNARDLRSTEWVAQHLAEVQYPDEDRYARLQGPSTTAWFDDSYFQELQDLRKVIERFKHLPDPPQVAGGLLFSCLGRGERLFGESDHDSRVFSEAFAQGNLGGFFCSGEIGPVGQGTFMHGFTSCFAVFSRP
mgnify:CR=1 FL=1